MDMSPKTCSHKSIFVSHSLSIATFHSIYIYAMFLISAKVSRSLDVLQKVPLMDVLQKFPLSWICLSRMSSKRSLSRICLSRIKSKNALAIGHYKDYQNTTKLLPNYYQTTTHEGRTLIRHSGKQGSYFGRNYVVVSTPSAASLTQKFSLIVNFSD